MNRRRMISIILLMIFVLSSVLPITGYAATNEAISLNSALYTAVKSNLEKQSIKATYNDMQHTISISGDEINKVTKLELSNKGITDLRGLEKFSKVTTLDLSGNQLTDESDLSILNSFNLTFLDLSSNQLSDVSAISNIKSIETVNLHNQILSKVEVIDNSIVKEGTYKYQCQLPQIVREFAKPVKADWIETSYEAQSNAELKFDIASFNANGDTIGLTIGKEDTKEEEKVDQFTGLATLKIKVNDVNNKLYNSEIKVHFVVIKGDQRAIFLKDKKLYEAVRDQLEQGQMDKIYNEPQILVINQNVLVNEIQSLDLKNKQLSDLSGLEMFVGLEKGLDLSSNYIKTIDTIIDLQEMKDIEEAKLQERFKEKAAQLQERLTTLEALETELDEAVKTSNEAIRKYNEYNKSENQEAGKTEKLEEMSKIIEEQKKKILELSGSYQTTINSDGSVKEVTKPIAGSKQEGTIGKAQEKVTEKEEEIYNIYNDVYKITSVITPELKNITDEEFDHLTLETAKALLQAQATKMSSIEKYFTSTEKDYLKANFEIVFDEEDKSKTPVANYFTEKLKDLEEEKNIGLYKTELTNLRNFDAYVMASSSCQIDRRILGIDSDKYGHRNYQIYVKKLDEENLGKMNEFLDADKHDNEDYDKDYHREAPLNEKVRNYFSRIANSTDEEIKAFITLPRLYVLNMSENLIENIDEISIMRELRELHMANNEISNLNNVKWSDIPWLNTLDLSFNNISDIKMLEDMKKLKYLDVSKNLLKGSFEFNLTSINFDKLKKFDLSGNQIEDIENLKSQFEFMAKADNNKPLNQYIKDELITKRGMVLTGQQLSMNLKVQKTADRIKVELPKIFRQFEEIDGDRTTFGIASVYGNASSDGTYVILETPTTGTRTAVVTVEGTGIGTGTRCFIQYTVEDNGDNNNNNDNVQININTDAGSSVETTKQVNNMNYIVVSKDKKVSDVLKDVTVNTDSYKVVIKDANAQNVINDTDKVTTNQTIILDGLSNDVQCRIVVKGDVTGDGSIDLGDVLRLNEYRLDNTKKLTDAEFIAGNIVDKDDKIDMSDILGLNEYRLKN